MKNNHRFNDAERAAIYRAIAERRDMRHFLPNPVDSCLLKRLLTAANQAPNVGLMQPWRFIRITDRNLRNAIASMVEEERQRTASALQERGDEFMHLKVEGIRECGELLVVALSDRREQYIFGRRTLPEMDLASVSCAIQNLWLAGWLAGWLRERKDWAWVGFHCSIRYSLPSC
jgi:5,6-dimethylbenzimidazole synthase